MRLCWILRVFRASHANPLPAVVIRVEPGVGGGRGGGGPPAGSVVPAGGRGGRRFSSAGIARATGAGPGVLGRRADATRRSPRGGLAGLAGFFRSKKFFDRR